MSLYVGKFGGGTFLLASSFNIMQNILDDNTARRHAVFSALGDQYKKEDRVTQMLLAMSGLRGQSLKKEGPAKEFLERLVAKHEKYFPNSGGIVGDRIRKEFGRNDLTLTEYVHNLAYQGEWLCTKLAADQFGAKFVDVTEFMLVDENGRILPGTYQRIANIFDDRLTFTPGYGGVTPEGKIVTLGEGSSDFSGGVIARGRNASVYENWTASPFYAADPRILKVFGIDPIRIPEMTREEQRDLSYSGSTILHKATLLPLAETSIPVHVRPFNKFPEKGTMVMSERVSDSKKPIIGVAYKENVASFAIQKPGLDDAKGVLSRLVQVIYDVSGNGRQLGMIFPTAGVDDMAFFLDQKQLHGNTASEMQYDFYDEMGRDGAKLPGFEDNLGVVVIAGKGIERKYGIEYEVGLALPKKGIKVMGHSMGPERRCVMYAVPGEQGYEAVKIIHEKFIR